MPQATRRLGRWVGALALACLLAAPVWAQVTPELAVPSAPSVGHYHTEFLPTAINLDADLTRAYALVMDFRFALAQPILKAISLDSARDVAVRSEAATLLGYTYLNSRESTQAVAALESALKLDPKNATALYFLASEHFLDGKTLAMQDCLRQAVTLRPNFVSAMRLLAESYADTGQTSNAVEYYKKIVNLLPQSGYYRFQLYRAEMLDGQYAQSERDLRALISLEPEVFSNYDRLGELYLTWREHASSPDERARLLEAARLAYQTLGLKQSTDYRSSLGLARCLAQEDDLDGALRQLQSASALASGNPEIDRLAVRWEQTLRERRQVRLRRLLAAGGGVLLILVLLGTIRWAQRRHTILSVLTRFQEKAEQLQDITNLRQFSQEFLTAELGLDRLALLLCSRDGSLHEHGASDAPNIRTTATKQLAQWYLRQPQSLLRVTDLQSDPSFEETFPGLLAQLSERGFQALVPLREGAMPRGFLALGWAGPMRLRRALPLLTPLAQLLAAALERLHLYESSLLDEMTGLANRRAFTQALALEFRRADRYHLPCSVVVFDLDNFKRINDTYGHPQGDRVLIELGELIRRSLRESIDVAARIGGEEFALILPATGLDRAVATAERILEKCRQHRFSGFAKPQTVTLSLGVATYPDHAEDEDELMRLADEAQYLAKRKGKNRVCSAGVVENLPAPALETARYDDLNILDGDTGLFTSAYLSLRLSEEIRRSARSREPVGILVVESDQVGVELRRLAITLREGVRDGIDLPARVGPTRLAVLLPNTDLQNSFFVAERLRARAEETGCPCSGGVASYPVHTQNPAELLAAATQALNSARQEGNVVFCAAAEDG